MSPELIPIVAGAVLAATGYVGKILLELIGDVLERAHHRRSQLVQLLSLLRAGRVAFPVQLEKREQLRELIKDRDPTLASSEIGFDRLFSIEYPRMTTDELELHSILRSITMYTIKPLNDSLVSWLNQDEFFKSKTSGHGLEAQLAEELADLEAHLLLWQAKFQVWMPDDPSRVFVYLADEEKHGVAFPKNIEGTVSKLLAKRWWVGG